jgi:endonuclease/exonuclease/phosphatase (EEP) superfamily protein YafD
MILFLARRAARRPLANTGEGTALTKILRTCLTALGLIGVAIASCALASRYLPITNHVVLFTAAFSPYLMISAPISMAFLIVARRWSFAVVATCLTVTMLAVQIPLYISTDTAPIEGVAVRVVSANLRNGEAEPEYLVNLARKHADILALQELTPAEADRLSAAGLDRAFPYRWLDARWGAQGVGVWSRFPLDVTSRIAGYTFALVTAQLRVAGVSTNPTIVVVHLPGPWPPPIESWRRDIDLLPATLREVAERTDSGCVIAAGDLNSTTDMRPFRALLRDGYRDAAEQSGAGIEPTFPADSRLPPLIAIDHILTRNCAASSLQTIKIPGSDHRGIVATVTIQWSPAGR